MPAGKVCQGLPQHIQVMSGEDLCYSWVDHKKQNGSNIKGSSFTILFWFFLSMPAIYESYHYQTFENSNFAPKYTRQKTSLWTFL